MESKWSKTLVVREKELKVMVFKDLITKWPSIAHVKLSKDLVIITNVQFKIIFLKVSYLKV